MADCLRLNLELDLGQQTDKGGVMAKIVYNSCYGGFSLSPLGLKRWAELKGRPCYFFINGRKRDGGLDLKARVPVAAEECKDLFFCAYDIPNPNEVLPSQENWGEMSMEERIASNEKYDKHSISCRDIERTDPHLIQVVEEMGDRASGRHSSLKIAEVPTGSRYRIDEYDGNESVMTPDDYEWKIA